MSNKIEAWHWLREDGCLSHPPHTKVKPGQTLRAEGRLSLCRNGMHYSIRAIDALEYIPGPIICRVEVSEERIEDHDKGCARERTCLWMADATQALHEFAIICAEHALTQERKAGREPDPRSWQVLEVKRKWLKGEATDSELEAARSAAQHAAWFDAAADAARCAATRHVVWSAARSAAAAARSVIWFATARSADWSAADAARSAARDRQNEILESFLWKLAPEGVEVSHD